ncbi:hypothetical protein [Mucilaginibacter aquariorum]|uniref:Uncharacterized protein n=1 Tax=Mucilaginibacter aquariorum TaxID=2967225 RepID=A0ABT1T1U7_9SPHI|nr:hypothetical protein [Mucilaginibacter aquariorum]MCQ6958591.1 hypothetical protein [Mucilaginibacter aquariorum]
MKRILNISIVLFATLNSCKPLTGADALINQKASLPESFRLSELHQKVITSFINNRKHTTSILYGNKVVHSILGADRANGNSGESFTLVTWQQQDDAHWFGARIPGDLISAETLTVADSNSQTIYHYQKFKGKELTKLADTTGNADRVRFILSKKASIMP